MKTNRLLLIVVMLGTVLLPTEAVAQKARYPGAEQARAEAWKAWETVAASAARMVVLLEELAEHWEEEGYDASEYWEEAEAAELWYTHAKSMAAEILRSSWRGMKPSLAWAIAAEYLRISSATLLDESELWEEAAEEDFKIARELAQQGYKREAANTLKYARKLKKTAAKIRAAAAQAAKKAQLASRYATMAASRGD